MMFKLGQSAQGLWRWLNGNKQITLILEGKKFLDGIQQAAA